MKAATLKMRFWSEFDEGLGTSGVRQLSRGFNSISTDEIKPCSAA